MSSGRQAGTVDGLTKGIPFTLPPTPVSALGSMGWNALRGDVPLPSALLLQSALQHNSNWMQRFIKTAGVEFSPHGKTTMAPDLFEMQLTNGAWGITAATMHQVRVYRAHGIKRILLANQLLQRLDVEYIVSELNQDAELEFFCLVDSVQGCRLLGKALTAARTNHPLQVLLEVGVSGRRTGCRDLESAIKVADAIRQHSAVMTLCGVEGFEGLIRLASDEETEAAVVAHLDLVVEVASALDLQGYFQGQEVVLSAGGSSHFDLVIQRFKQARLSAPCRIIVRSGCYITHDYWMYRIMIERMFERSPELQKLGAPLRPALEMWALVQSRPEPTRAICTIGKRDLGIDALPPTLEKWFRPGHHATPTAEGIAGDFVEINDQHAHAVIPVDSPLEVGDLVCLGVSHPCTTFDKWKLLYLVDDDYNIVSAIETFF